MLATNYTNVRQNLAHYCNEAVQNGETVIVTRKNDENVVLISEAEYNNLMENLFVRSNTHDYQRLLDSIAHLKAGKGKMRELSVDE
ncbi:MAG: type II toxin-antitoxin system prevent-host-death family antitoxin [Clostridiales Family XIII bacterium]|jgi:antitoxin YefM|nr:type II toxin-antitoxin system prevent-host-death family antitoxin [Clostridiales Family XIII bacterium]